MSDRSTSADLIASAIRAEEEASLFYRMMSELLSDPAIVAKFRSLADDEKEHAEMLTSLYAELTGGADPPRLAGIAPEGQADLFGLGTRSEKEVLAFALNNEIDAIRLYEAQAEASPDNKTASILQLLADTEREHAQYLQLQLELLSTTKQS